MRKRRERSEAQPSEARNVNDREPETLDELESGQRRTRPRRTRGSNLQPNNPSQEAVEALASEAPIPGAPPPNDQIPAGGSEEEKPAAQEEEIDNELTCALCHDLYVNPVVSPCGHAFCSLCHLRLFSVRLAGEPGVPPAQRSRPCPLCRQKHKSEEAAPQASLDTRARTQHPELYTRRSLEVAAAIEQLNASQPHYFTLTVGNTCEQTPAVRTRSGISRAGRTDWQFFVELRDASGEDVDGAAYIDQVVMHLCGGEGRQVCSAPPYLVHRSTNGAIRRMCYAIVYFKPETRLQPVAVTWLLNMTPGRHCLDVPLELCRREGGENTNTAGGGARGDGAVPQQGMDGTDDDPEGGYFGHFASVTGPARNNLNAAAGDGLMSEEGAVAGLGALYPVLAGLLETFIRMDNVHRRAF
jgi:hypothetical protein